MASNKFKLSQEERSSLKAMLKKGVHRSVELMRARVLLSLDAQKKKSDISKDESIAYATVFNILNRYKTGGLKNAIYDSPRPGQPVHITAEQRAKITALACSEPPTGHLKWSLRLLADRAVELEIITDISHESIRSILKKTP
ncbi:MAG: helix-turn-helix domain-containing protein [Saprospiraceae bacterium]